MKKGNSVFTCIDSDKVDSKPYSVLVEKPKFKYKFKERIVRGRKKVRLIISSKKKGIWHIPSNF